MHPVHGMCKKLSKRSAVSKVKAFDEEKHERDHNKKKASLCTAKPLFDNDFDHIFKLICMWIQQ